MPVLIVNVTTDDRATPFLRQIGEALASPEMRRVFGRATVPVIKDNFRALEASSRSTLGHSGYWDQAAQSVQQPQIQTDGLSIGVSKAGVGLHYFGGTVRPGKNASRATGRPTKYLTIPARSEAYAKRAGEFSNLKILFGKGRRPVALVEADNAPSYETHLQTSRSGVVRRVRLQKPPEKSGGIIMFWLVKQATIRANRNVVPSTEAMTTPAFQAVISYLKRAAERETGGAAS